MSGGLFAVDRGVFDHRLFANEPYTERLAWMWLISEAAWKPKSVRTPHGMVRIDRGQLVHSQRFLASKWQWDRSRVRRFLDLLESEKMIAQQRPSFDPAKGPASTQQKAQQTAQLTICNYEKYQFGGPRDEPSSNPETTQLTDQKRPKEEELINNNKDADGASAPPNVVSITPSPEKLFFDQAAQILGPDGRGLAAKLLKAKDKNVMAAHAVLLTAAQKSDPRQYLGAVIRGDTEEDRRKRWAF